MKRPNLPVSRSLAWTAILAWTATLAGQLTGLLLVLAPAVAHPLPMDGGVRVSVQLLAAVAGAAGVVIVAAGLLGELVEDGDEGPRAGLVAVPRPGFARGAVGVLALALLVVAAVCLTRTSGPGGAEYLPAAVMFGLTAAAAAALLRGSRRAWTPDRS